MKLVAVLGSTRNGSKSELVAKEVIRSAKEAGHEVVIFYETEMNIKGCVGCGSCRGAGSDCVFMDDFQKYLKELHSCDALLVTAPNYYSQIAGHMITFMNRHYCLTNADRTSRLKPGIKLIGIFSQGAPTSLPNYEANYDWFLDTFLAKGMKLVGKIVLTGSTDFSAGSDVMKHAYQLGKLEN